MKTAILISGQTRSYSDTYQNQKLMVYSKMPDPHFFVSVANDEDAHRMDVLKRDYPEDRVRIEVVDQPDQAEPENLQQLSFAAPEPIAPHSSIQGVLKQYWHLVRVAEFAGGPAGLLGFDLVVRCRPDLKFHSFPDNIDLPPGNACVTPWWARAGGVNDRFAIMRPAAVKAYFYTLVWAKMTGWARGYPVHPESMLAASLYDNGCTVCSSLATTFSIIRKDGRSIAHDPHFADLADLLLNRVSKPPKAQSETPKQ